MNSDRNSKAVALSGVFAAFLALFVVLIAGYLQPDFNHKTQFISELNAQGSRYQNLIGYLGFVPVGCLTLLFLWRLKDELAHSRRVIIGLVFVALMGNDWLVTAFAPCDAGCPVSGDISLSQKIHMLSAVLVTFLLPIGIYLLIDPLRKAGFTAVAILLSKLTIAVLVLTFIISAAAIAPEYKGLLQRVSAAFFYLYIAVLSMEVWRRDSQVR